MPFRTCETCNLCLLTEDKRIKWCGELSVKNIQLLDKISMLQNTIKDLEYRLIEREKIIYINNFTIIANYLEEMLTKKEVKNSDLKDTLKEIRGKIEDFNKGEIKFAKMLDRKEQDFTETIIAFKEMADFYRETLCKEMKEFYGIKSYLIEEAKKLETKNNIVKENNETKGNKKLYAHYKNLIKQNNEELKNKEYLIDKLRNDRKLLYVRISELKQQHNSKQETLSGEIERLKTVNVKLKEKCERDGKRSK